MSEQHTTPRRSLMERFEAPMLEKLLSDMILIRAFDSRLPKLYSKGLIRGSTHAALGQEAVAVGACATLRRTDLVASTHRGHGHMIAKGADTGRMMAELLGRSDGYCRGKGGSMHIADFSIGMLGANGVVGGGFGLATGAALSATLRHTDQIVVCFFGDGAVNQGLFLEAGNLAAIWRLPVVFVCENNQFAMSSRPTDTTAVSSLVERARGVGIDGIEIDGMDVVAVHEAVREAGAKARSGEGPTFIEAKCFRYEGHFSGDTMRYRQPAELAEWMARDPIDVFTRELISIGAISEAAPEELREKAEALIDVALAFAEASPFPEPDQAWEDVCG